MFLLEHWPLGRNMVLQHGLDCSLLSRPVAAEGLLLSHAPDVDNWSRKKGRFKTVIGGFWANGTEDSYRRLCCAGLVARLPNRPLTAKASP